MLHHLFVIFRIEGRTFNIGRSTTLFLLHFGLSQSCFIIVKIRLAILLLNNQTAMSRKLIKLQLLYHLNMLLLLLLLSRLSSQYHRNLINFIYSIIFILCLCCTLSFMMLDAHYMVNAHLSSTSIIPQPTAIVSYTRLFWIAFILLWFLLHLDKC